MIVVPFRFAVALLVPGAGTRALLVLLDMWRSVHRLRRRSAFTAFRGTAAELCALALMLPRRSTLRMSWAAMHLHRRARSGRMMIAQARAGMGKVTRRS